MFSSKIKVAIALTAVLMSSFDLLATTDNGIHLATVIAGADSQVAKCIQALPEGKRGLQYISEKKRLNTDSRKDIVLTATSDSQCGSAGCTHELCLINDNQAEIISFGYASETLTVKDVASNGMYDIQLQGKSTTDLQWDGTRYIVLK